jgi:PKD repeat protein
MEFWHKSSTGIKAAIVVGAGLVLILLIALIVNFSNRGTESGQAPEPIATVTGVVTVAPPEPTIVPPTPETGAPTVTAMGIVNVRSGPGVNYPRIGLLIDGQTANAIGRSADSAWWVIEFPVPPDNQGWVAAEYITATSVENVPIIQAPTLPEPTAAPPVPITDWRGEYFANQDLAGDPMLVRNDAAINFNWGTNPPAPGMPAANWSARWTINRNVPAGTYRFSAWVDDGLRILVDNQLVLDGWQTGPARNYTVDVNVTAGAHQVRVEYFQTTGGALLQLDIGYIEGYPEWKSEYFSNPNLEEPPIVVRNEQNINYDWGAAPPVSGIPANNWSARWTRTFYLESGDYTIMADVEGAVRLWMDGRILIDSWDAAGSRALQVDTGAVNAGNHEIKIEYFKLTGNGHLTVTAQEADGDPIPPTAVIQGPTRGSVGEELQFTSTGSTVAVGSHVVAADWDFGDGTAISGVSISHVYQAPGVYQIKLTVTDDKGLSDTTSQQVNIADAAVTPPPPQPPVAVIDAPQQAEAGETITFYAGNSQSVSPILTYAWNFGDGAVGDAETVEKIYAEPGVYTVNLTVIDDQGLRSDAQQQIAIREAAPTTEPTGQPTAAPTALPTVAPTQPVGPTPAEPTPEVTPPPAETPVEPEPTVAPTEPPPSPGDGTPTQPVQPVIEVTIDGVQAPIEEVNGVKTITVPAGATFQIDASQAVATNPALTLSWDMGDGQPPLTGPVIQYSYAQPGTYPVVVTVSDGEGNAQTNWQVVVQ